MTDMVEQYFKIKGMEPPKKEKKKRGRPKSKMNNIKEGKKQPNYKLEAGELDPNRKKYSNKGAFSTLSQPKQKKAPPIKQDGRLYTKKNHNVQQCSTCGHLKEYDLSNFYYIKRRGNRNNTISTMCRKCRNAKSVQYSKKYQRTDEFKKKYVERRAVNSRFPEGTTVSWVKKNFPGGCTVCGNHNVSKFAPVFDSTRKIIDVICYDCYQGLRRLYWDTSIIERAKGFTEEYLDNNYDIEFKGIRTLKGNRLKQNYVPEK